MKVISEKTKFIEEMKRLDKKELREIRFNNKLIKDIDSAYFILPDAIIILKANEKEQLGIYIKEESTAKLHKNIFNLLWKISKHF